MDGGEEDPYQQPNAAVLAQPSLDTRNFKETLSPET